jgi:hypothetical protein
MRFLAMTAAGLGLLAMTAATSVNSASAGDRFELQAPIRLAQAEPKKPEAKKPEVKKSETVTQKVKRKSKEVKQKVKRAWRDMSGYKFNVGCPALIPLTRSTCTETGKDRETARATCQQKNLLCSVTDAK